MVQLRDRPVYRKVGFFPWRVASAILDSARPFSLWLFYYTTLSATILPLALLSSSVYTFFLRPCGNPSLDHPRDFPPLPPGRFSGGKASTLFFPPSFSSPFDFFLAREFRRTATVFPPRRVVTPGAHIRGNHFEMGPFAGIPRENVILGKTSSSFILNHTEVFGSLSDRIHLSPCPQNLRVEHTFP